MDNQQQMYQQPVQPKKTNGMCIAGLVCAFLLPLVGLILSIVGIRQAKNRNENGEGMAIAGIIIGAIGTVVSFIAILLIVFSYNVFTTVNNNVELSTACANLDSHGDYKDPEGKVRCEDFVCTYKDGGVTLTKTCINGR